MRINVLSCERDTLIDRPLNSPSNAKCSWYFTPAAPALSRKAFFSLFSAADLPPSVAARRSVPRTKRCGLSSRGALDSTTGAGFNGMSSCGASDPGAASAAMQALASAVTASTVFFTTDPLGLW
jgi:hypothetical protein